MGNIESSESPVRQHIEDEFKRVKGSSKRNFLVLKEVTRLRSLDERPVNFSHLGVLYFLDSGHNGRFHVSDLVRLARYYREVGDRFRDVGLGSRRSDHFVDWFTLLLMESFPPAFLTSHPGVQFVAGDAVKHLHKMFNIENLYGMDYQRFFDMLQQFSEDIGIMPLNDDKLDDYAPYMVVKQFARFFIGGFTSMISELGFGGSVGNQVCDMCGISRGVSGEAPAGGKDHAHRQSAGELRTAGSANASGKEKEGGGAPQPVTTATVLGRHATLGQMFPGTLPRDLQPRQHPGVPEGPLSRFEQSYVAEISEDEDESDMDFSDDESF